MTSNLGRCTTVWGKIKKKPMQIGVLSLSRSAIMSSRSSRRLKRTMLGRPIRIHSSEAPHVIPLSRATAVAAITLHGRCVPAHAHTTCLERVRVEFHHFNHSTNDGLLGAASEL